MFKFTRILIQSTKSTTSFHGFTRSNYSTATTVELKNITLENGSASNIKSADKNTSEPISRNNIVATVFASLQNENKNEIKTPHTESLISSANTVNELLSVSAGNSVSRKHALHVVSILADWSMKGKAKLPEFESDPRFIRLCKILIRTNYKTNKTSVRSEDLSTILSVTADDEAAKLVESLTLPQMVKVMSTLTQKKRRSPILLRSLSFNITRNSDVLDLKQCGDILYSMATLNFPDENLLQRTCIDVSKGINENLQKSSVLGSILTSLGLLKYKDNGILEASCQWMTKYIDLCRSQDIFALFLTMAVLNYDPPNPDDVFEKLLPQLNIADATRSSVWLDLVWSLVLLNKVTPELISSVFSKDFIDKLDIENGQNTAYKLKLININSAIQYLMPNYTGPNLQSFPEIQNVEILRSKEKEAMSTSIIECLKNLMSDKHIKTKVNTQLGFYIDAECYLDNKCNPILPECFTNSPQQRKIAIIALDYHDMCKGSTEPTGTNTLAIKLLEAKGYRVLTIPYTEYRSTDKLVDRVQYLELKLKSIVQL